MQGWPQTFFFRLLTFTGACWWSASYYNGIRCDRIRFRSYPFSHAPLQGKLLSRPGGLDFPALVQDALNDVQRHEGPAPVRCVSLSIPILLWIFFIVHRPPLCQSFSISFSLLERRAGGPPTRENLTVWGVSGLEYASLPVMDPPFFFFRYGSPCVLTTRRRSLAGHL